MVREERDGWCLRCPGGSKELLHARTGWWRRWSKHPLNATDFEPSDLPAHVCDALESLKPGYKGCVLVSDAGNNGNW